MTAKKPKETAWFRLEIKVEAPKGSDPYEVESELMRRLDSGDDYKLIIDTTCSFCTEEEA